MWAIRNDRNRELHGEGRRPTQATVDFVKHEFTGVADSFMAEAKAAVYALDFAYDMGFTSIILKEDALSIIKKIQDSDADLSPIETLVAEAKHKVSLFCSCSFRHAGREGNKCHTCY
ncbi:hypothetical protein CRYUN_Cryun13aG0048300 [Craigia yunnanensis]